MRYLRLFLHFVSFSFSRSAMFRIDFFFRIVMDCFYYGVNIAFYKLIYGTTTLLGGWREDQTMVFLALFLLIDAVHMTLFSNNMWVFPILVNRGELDYYLLRPINSLFFVSLRDFAANSFMNLLITLGIMAYAISHYQGEFSILQWILLGLGIVLGVVIQFSIRTIFLLPVFWTQSSRGFDGLFHQAARVAERPDRIFSGVMRVIFTVVMPFSLIASFPARLLVEEPSLSIAIHLLLGAIGVYGFMLWIWQLALRNYSSASS